jgi:hypothetical protein
MSASGATDLQRAANFFAEPFSAAPGASGASGPQRA